jgi:amino acid transporter
MNQNSFVAILILAFVTAVVSLTITKSSLFQRLREWALEINEWLGKLVSCMYCTGHWVSFGLVSLYRPKIIYSAWWPIDLLVSAFVIVALAMPIAFVVYQSFQRIVPPNNDEADALRAALTKAREKIVEQDRQLKAYSATTS